MDDTVRAAMAKWPNVPACYDWLALDARGTWRLNGAPVRHAGLAEFLGRNYGHDEGGNWFSQNGPQRVFVTLALTPWVLRRLEPDRLTSHIGRHVPDFSASFLDESGRLLLEFEQDSETQIGLVCDQDLPVMLEHVIDRHGHPAQEEDLLAVMEGGARSLQLIWAGQRIPLMAIRAETLPARYGYRMHPAPCS